MRRWSLFGAALLLAGCGTTFRSDLAFLKCHTETIVLLDRERDARVAVCPALQGRVMTSTATGDGGLSYGWINYEAIASGELKPHINVYGGEDRFWLGPEGGQFSIFFKKGASPRDIGRTLRTPVTPKSIVEAAKNLCPATDGVSAAYAELWAVKAASTKLLFPWVKDSAGFPYPPHLTGLVDSQTGDVDRVELDRRIEELRPHAHV